MESARSRSLIDRALDNNDANSIPDEQLPASPHATEQRPELTVMPLRHCKIVHLVRHAQGYHNVYGEKNEKDYASWDFEDAHLTSLGWQQAAALRKHIAGTRGIRPEVVIVSPLTRTMETAVGVFGGQLSHESDAELPLMREVPGVPERSTAHPAVAPRPDLPFVACELCREHLGKHPCDKRRSLAAYRQEFPGIDLSLVETEEDTWWKPDVRETDEEIAERGYEFFRWLMQRPETEIAVVSHSSILHYTLSNFGRASSPAVQGDLHRYFANCELRTMIISDSGGDGNIDPTWFNPLQSKDAANGIAA